MDGNQLIKLLLWANNPLANKYPKDDNEIEVEHLYDMNVKFVLIAFRVRSPSIYQEKYFPRLLLFVVRK